MYEKDRDIGQKLCGPETQACREHSRDILRQKAEQLRRKAAQLDSLAIEVGSLSPQSEELIWHWAIKL